jgi:citrate synthase
MRIADMVLVVLMEHGLTPSAIATRLIYMSAPENLQGAVSAGLLAVGSSFVGTMENCSTLLDRILAAQDPDAEALAIARHYKEMRAAVPGFGHHLHKPVDPRVQAAGTRRCGAGSGRRAYRRLRRLSAAVDEVAGRPITINATGRWPRCWARSACRRR